MPQRFAYVQPKEDLHENGSIDLTVHFTFHLFFYSTFKKIVDKSMKTPVANFLRRHLGIFLVGVTCLAVGIAYLSHSVLHLCNPASVYVGIASWSILFLSLYSVSHIIKKLPLTTFAIEGIQAIFWTWLITLLCSKGYTILSWALAIVSVLYYAVGILLNLDI